MPYITLNIRITAAAPTENSTSELGHAYVVSASVNSTSRTVLKEIISPDDPGNPNDPENPENPGKPAQAAFIISSNIEERLHQILIESSLRTREEAAQRAKKLGIELFNYLFQPEIKTLYQKIKDKVQQRQQFVIRLRLQIVPAELSTLPWELLHDGEEYLCLNSHPKILFARVPDTTVTGKTLNYDPPLRFLGITASPDGQNQLNVGKEKEYIDIALKDLVEKNYIGKDWKKAEKNVLSGLKSGDTVHILHFIGHGHFSDGEGKIIFEGERGRGLSIPANQLRLALQRDTTLLVFLNACDTARGDSQDYLSNFAYKLAVTGIPAIVAMQFKITDDAAIQFAKTFYERIATGEPIDEAVTEARHHIFVHSGSLEWIAPVLYISSSNSVLFKSSQPQPPITEMGPIPLHPQTPNRSRLYLFAAVLGVLLLLLGTLGGWFIFGRVAQSGSPPTTFCLATDLPTGNPLATDLPTGDASTIGRGIQTGVELAFMKSPLSTKYHGYSLKSYYKDDSGPNGGPDPATGVKNLQDVLHQPTSCPNPIAVIGPYDSPTAVSEIPLAARNHLLLLSPSNTAACLTQSNYSNPPACDYSMIHPQGSANTYARLTSTNPIEGGLDADFLIIQPNSTNPALGGLGAQRIAIVGDEEIYGTELAKAIIPRLGKRLVGIDCVKPPDEYKKDHSCSQLSPRTEAFSTDNIPALAAKIRDEYPDAIFFSGRPDRGAGLLRQQLGELGLDSVPFVGGGGLVANGNFFTTLGSHAANIYATFPAADPSTFTSGTGAMFINDYKNEFGTSPQGYTANGYDAANIILQVVQDLINKDQPVTRESVAQAVLSHNFTGVAGNNIQFDQYGDNIGKRVYTIYESKQQTLGTWDWMALGQQVV
jgi:ABC-type branched-subunit amino acid transport system substrate-binding protein/CHAT domain-containing protein